MVRPALRSRSFRKMKKNTPGGRVVMHYPKRKNSRAKCGDCGKPLGGVPIKRDADIKNIPKTKKRPDRPFGGNLCPACTKQRIKDSLISKSI